MSEFNVEDWKLSARAVVKLKRNDSTTFVSILLFICFIS